jgi:hypothetical protein
MSIEANTDWAEKVLAGPLSEDLPENIEAIDKAVGKAYLAGELDFGEPFDQFERKLEALLRSKGLLPDWDIKDLALKLTGRFTLRSHSWDFGLGERQAEYLALYQRLKDRPSVQKVVAVGGLCHDTFLVIRSIAAIDERLAKGETYADVYNSIVYLDDEPSNHAFLNHVEERSNTEIKSSEQLHNIADLPEDLSDDVGLCFSMALMNRYFCALDKALREGAKYEKLLTIGPEDFGLPGDIKEASIRRAIHSHFNLGETVFQRVPLRDVADAIEAPYGEVLKASKYPEQDDKDDGKPEAASNSTFSKVVKHESITDDEFKDLFYDTRKNYHDIFGFTPEDVLQHKASYPIAEIAKDFKEDILHRVETGELPSTITIDGRKVDTLSVMTVFMFYEARGKEPEHVAADIGPFNESDYWDNTKYFSDFGWFLFIAITFSVGKNKQLVKVSKAEEVEDACNLVKNALIKTCIRDQPLESKINLREALGYPVIRFEDMDEKLTPKTKRTHGTKRA